jgi:hypothetical protein
LRGWLLVILLFGIIVGHSFARELLQGEQCTVAEDDTLRGTMFVLCENLQIEGRVQGDVIGLAFRTTITGDVNGDIYLAGGELVMEGRVTGSIHYAGVALDIQPSASDDVPDEDASSPRLPPHVHELQDTVQATTLNNRQDQR